MIAKISCGGPRRNLLLFTASSRVFSADALAIFAFPYLLLMTMTFGKLSCILAYLERTDYII